LMLNLWCRADPIQIKQKPRTLPLLQRIVPFTVGNMSL